MNDSPEPETIPKWRIIFWGVVAAVGVDSIIYAFKDNPASGHFSPFQYLFGPFAGAFICGLGFMATSARAQANKERILKERDRLNRDPMTSDENRTPQKGSLVFRILFSLLAALFLFIAGMGIYDGHISSAGRHSHREIYATHEPLVFWITVAFYAGIGAFLLYAVFRKPK